MNEQHQVVFFPISLDELTSVITDIVRTEIKSLPLKEIKPEANVFITRKDAAKRLGVSLVTLNEWTKTGILKGYSIGSRIRYIESEVESALIPVPCRELV